MAQRGSAGQCSGMTSTSWAVECAAEKNEAIVGANTVQRAARNVRGVCPDAPSGCVDDKRGV
eukprot:2105511-Pleurochrysis_carterae.AAC.1